MHHDSTLRSAGARRLDLSSAIDISLRWSEKLVLGSSSVIVHQSNAIHVPPAGAKCANILKFKIRSQRREKVASSDGLGNPTPTESTVRHDNTLRPAGARRLDLSSAIDISLRWSEKLVLGSSIALRWSAEIGSIICYRHIAPLERKTGAGSFSSYRASIQCDTCRPAGAKKLRPLPTIPCWR